MRLPMLFALSVQSSIDGSICNDIDIEVRESMATTFPSCHFMTTRDHFYFLDVKSREYDDLIC